MLRKERRKGKQGTQGGQEGSGKEQQEMGGERREGRVQWLWRWRWRNGNYLFRRRGITGARKGWERAARGGEEKGCKLQRGKKDTVKKRKEEKMCKYDIQIQDTPDTPQNKIHTLSSLRPAALYTAAQHRAAHHTVQHSMATTPHTKPPAMLPFPLPPHMPYLPTYLPSYIHTNDKKKKHTYIHTSTNGALSSFHPNIK